MIQIPTGANPPDALADLFGPPAAVGAGSQPVPAKAAVPADASDPADAEIINPFDGELVAVDDVDGLIDLYEKMKRVSDQAYGVMQLIRRAAGNLAKGDTKTRRLQGERRKAKVTRANDSWDQSILKEAFFSFPNLRDQVLKIDSVGVKLREYEKLKSTSGSPDVETFRDMVVRANRGVTGLPTIEIEE